MAPVFPSVPKRRPDREKARHDPHDAPISVNPEAVPIRNCKVSGVVAVKPGLRLKGDISERLP